MRIPDEFKLCGATWKVKFDHDMADDGQTSPENQVITINSSNCRETQLRAFVHELLHACAIMAAIEDDEELSEEKFIRRIEGILFSYLLEN